MDQALAPGGGRCGRCLRRERWRLSDARAGCHSQHVAGQRRGRRCACRSSHHPVIRAGSLDRSSPGFGRKSKPDGARRQAVWALIVWWIRTPKRPDAGHRRIAASVGVPNVGTSTASSVESLTSLASQHDLSNFFQFFSLTSRAIGGYFLALQPTVADHCGSSSLKIHSGLRDFRQTPSATGYKFCVGHHDRNAYLLITKGRRR